MQTVLEAVKRGTTYSSDEGMRKRVLELTSTGAQTATLREMHVECLEIEKAKLASALQADEVGYEAVVSIASTLEKERDKKKRRKR